MHMRMHQMKCTEMESRPALHHAKDGVREIHILPELLAWCTAFFNHVELQCPHYQNNAVVACSFKKGTAMQIYSSTVPQQLSTKIWRCLYMDAHQYEMQGCA